MAHDDPIRASDADRDVVVRALREAFEAGRLTLDEFNERMASAYSGRTWGDLRPLTGDLPVQPTLGADIPGRAPLDRLSPDSPSLDRISPGHGVLDRPGHPLVPAQDQGAPAGLPGTEDDPAEQDGTPPVPARRRPVGLLVPLAVWALLVVHNAVSPGAVFLLIAIFAIFAVMASIRRR